MNPQQSTHTSSFSTVVIEGQELVLDPLCAVWWDAQRTLVVSDVHVGKAGHFAANGIAVPGRALQENCWNLAVLYDRYTPRSVIFLGDLYHSSHNREWDVFADFQKNYPQVTSVLVKGNHEFLPDDHYQRQGLEVVDRLDLGPFRFVHEPDHATTERYHMCGHIHPAVVLRGQNDRLRLPCFWFGKSLGVLPAFGSMTGTHRVHPKKGDQVFVSTGEAVVQV